MALIRIKCLQVDAVDVWQENHGKLFETVGRRNDTVGQRQFEKKIYIF